jgi:hypothetical protein
LVDKIRRESWRVQADFGSDSDEALELFSGEMVRLRPEVFSEGLIL